MPEISLCQNSTLDHFLILWYPNTKFTRLENSFWMFMCTRKTNFRRVVKELPKEHCPLVSHMKIYFLCSLNKHSEPLETVPHSPYERHAVTENVNYYSTSFSLPAPNCSGVNYGIGNWREKKPSGFFFFCNWCWKFHFYRETDGLSLSL